MGLDYVEFPTLPIVTAHLIVNCILALLTLLVVGLRLVSRFLAGAGLWWDDYLILFALPQGLGMVVIQGMWIKMGIGYPITQTLPNITIILKLLVSYELIYSTAISTIKMSALLFYMRVFVNDGLRLATKLTIGFVMLWSTGNILQVFLICRPFRATYDPSVQGECGDQIASFIAIGAFNIVTDLLILTLPIPTIWSLSMRLSTRVGILGVFSIGLLVSVVAMIRIVTLTDLDLNNLTGTMIWADFWSAFEPNLGILCVSLPMLGSLWSRCVSRRRGASKLEPSSSGGYGASGTGFSRLKNGKGKRSDLDTEFGLESIYGANQAVHCQTAVAAAAANRAGGSSECGGGFAGERVGNTTTGSQVALTPEPFRAGETDPGGIQVHTKWTITRLQQCEA